MKIEQNDNDTLPTTKHKTTKHLKVIMTMVEMIVGYQMIRVDSFGR